MVYRWDPLFPTNKIKNQKMSSSENNSGNNTENKIKRPDWNVASESEWRMYDHVRTEGIDQAIDCATRSRAFMFKGLFLATALTAAIQILGKRHCRYFSIIGINLWV